MLNEIIEYSTIDELIAKRDFEAKKILEIEKLFHEISSSTRYLICDKFKYHFSYSSTLEDIRRELDKSYWHDVLNKMQIEKFTTNKDKQAIFERIDKEVPHFNEKDVREYLKNLIESPEALANNLIKKVYDSITQMRFRVGNNYRGNVSLKNGNGIEKSFRASVFSSGNELPWHISRDRGQWPLIADLESACFMCDGKIRPDYHNDIIALIDNALKNKKDEASNGYFKIKLFKNGNVKIDFENLEVLNTLNLWGANGSRLRTK